MCGITGFWDSRHQLNPESRGQIAHSMGLTLQTRGPDSHGIWQHSYNGLVFSHRRLSIVDLSPTGHQPMVSHSGQTIVSFNGEIYNTSELRQELQDHGICFRGTSDTKVIVEGCEYWGVLKTAQKLWGMFAFSVWCEKTQRLYLVRDRVGKKPLYWGWINDTLFFGSQLKSFYKHPHWHGVIDQQALALYLRYNYVPTPYSIFRNIHKAEAGHVITIGQDKSVDAHPFWQLEQVVKQAEQNPFIGNDAEAISVTDELLRDTVKRRMMADVSLGAFLSGGVDSSLITALMQAQSTQPIKTFSIGFHEPEFNEAHHAKIVAEHLKTDHTELYLHAREAATIVPTIADWCDEPFADSSQIPTYLVSKLARGTVTVSLSGDGGDELFAGYNRYHGGYRIWKRISALPYFMRRGISKSIQKFSPELWQRWAQVIPTQYRPPHFGNKMHVLATMMNNKSQAGFYKMCVDVWSQPDKLLKSPIDCPLHFIDTVDTTFLNHPVKKMQYWDILTYLMDDIMTKVDRASMAVSLEARSPFLDHRIIELSWQLPMVMKIRHGQGKWILRQVLNHYVPQSLIDRPKMGFGVPIGEWLKSDLKDWAGDLLNPQRLHDENIFNPHVITQHFNDHVRGQRDWKYKLWNILMFQQWRERWHGAISE